MTQRIVWTALALTLAACSSTSSSAPTGITDEDAATADTAAATDTAAPADSALVEDAVTADTSAPDTSAGGAENTRALCSDGKDNDGDGFWDCGDRDCCSVIDCSARPTTYCGKLENNSVTCSDGKDNDGDGFIDCGDIGCCDAVDCVTKAPGSYCAKKKAPPVPENTAALCANGTDDDADGFIDCNDRSCCSVVDCSSKPTTFCGGGGCTDPKYPVFCPAKGSVNASCWTAGTVCSTITPCGATYKSCTAAGQIVDCATNQCVTPSPPDAGVASPHVVKCGSTTARPQWCACTGQDSNTGTTTIEGKCEKDPSFAAMRCCASSDYPKTGTCACYLSKAYGCSGFPSFGRCSCSFYSNSEYYTSVCNNVPDADGTKWMCCFDAKFMTCDCETGRTSCPTGETVVADCANAAALGVKSFAGCPSGQTETNGCSGSPSGTCTKDSDCGGSCSGSDPVCCPVCSGGHCTQNCCGTLGCF